MTRGHRCEAFADPILRRRHPLRRGVDALARAAVLGAGLATWMVSASACSAPATAAADARDARSASAAPAPDFSLPTLDGRRARLSDFKGKVVLIDFWSTTCEPCMVEMPHLVDLYKKHRDRGFVVLAIAVDGPESRAQVAAAAHDRAMNFPVLLDEESAVVARYNPKKEMPFAVLVDRSGAVAHKRSGYRGGDEKTLEAEVEKTLAK